MINALVLDDEYILVQDISTQLEKRKGWEAAPFINPDEALRHLKETDVDVCFVDIEMPGQNGLEFAATVKDLWPDILIVFVTAYSEYAADAFRVRAYDYLVKPVARDLLSEVCDGVEVALEARQQGQQIIVGKRIAVKSATRIDFVEVDRILYGQSLGNYISLRTANKEFLHRAKISEMADELAPSGFIRTHRSFIVQSNAVVSAQRKGDNLTALELQDGHTVPVSSSHSSEVASVLRDVHGMEF